VLQADFIAKVYNMKMVLSWRCQGGDFVADSVQGRERVGRLRDGATDDQITRALA
jgi:hypothetical protein